MQYEQKDHLEIIQEPVKNAVATLVLGILAIVTCIFYGIFSFILGIIALAISNTPRADYLSNPDMYDRGTYSQLKAGRICAIVGICLSVAFWLVIFISFALLQY
jgi:hypothetical protein